MKDTARNLRILLVIAALAASVQALATPTIHKCVDAFGKTSYQSAPCAADRREAWTRTWEPEPAPSARANAGGEQQGKGRHAEARTSTRPRSRRQDAPQPSARARSRGASRSRATAAHLGVTANSLSPACQAARQRRERTLERVGLKRTYALLQKLDDAVHRACN